MFYLCGETGATAASHGLVGDVSSEDRLDGVEEAGLPGSHRSNEQNPDLGDRPDERLVGLDVDQQLPPIPVGTRDQHGKHMVLGEYSSCLLR